MSAKAPSGKVNRKNGKDATADISDRNNADALSLYITQVAAQSWAATQVPESTLANQSFRNTGFRTAVKVEVFFKLLLIGALLLFSGLWQEHRASDAHVPSFQNQEHLQA
jgi:hypothetical protein